MAAEHWALLATMFLGGLAGSLHCVGMCGPVLAGLQSASAGTAHPGARLAAHHVGRLWSYAFLGLLAGTLGGGVRRAFEGQRVVAVAIGGMVLINGMLMLRRSRTDRERAVAARFAQGLRRLLDWTGGVRASGIPARLTVGALLGFMPCGLVWSMLIPAAAMPGPIQAALAMIAFGLGTVPALSAVVLATGRLSPALRRRGRPAVACLLILSGGWMIGRTLVVDPEAPESCHGSAARIQSSQEHP